MEGLGKQLGVKTELTPEELKQYSRHLLLDKIGDEGQLKLKKAKVLVIGAGGLGCPILQYLAAAGVGTLGIIDSDHVDQSNLQRQVLYSHSEIGTNKAKAAAERLSQLNPYIQFDVYEFSLNNSNALGLFRDYDIIVDGSDNFPTRYLVNDACVLTDKPLVFGSIFKFEGQVSVFNFNKGPTYRCLFPNPPKPGDVPNCSEIGVLGVLPGIIGSLQANEVLKLICEIGDPLSGKLLTFDALSLNQQIFSFSKNPNIQISQLESNYEGFCGINTAIIDITADNFLSQKSNFELLDVRTLEEREHYHIGGKHIPLHELDDRINELSDLAKPLVVYCEAGIRSARAIEVLQEYYPKAQLFNLKGGVSQIRD